MLASTHAHRQEDGDSRFPRPGAAEGAASSYVEETPVWKTSYRLVLGEKESPLLQGWAIVENPTEEDWNDVRLTLVSGRPISFTMDLYQPLYIPRPVEMLELYSSLRRTVLRPGHGGRSSRVSRARVKAKAKGRLSLGC